MTDIQQAQPGVPMDFQQNGVFFDNYSPTVFNRPNPPTKAIIVTTDLSYISGHDGSSKTLMLSENLDALDWIALPPTNVSVIPQQPTLPLGPSPNETKPPQLPGSGAPTQNGNSWWQAFTWYVAPPPPPATFGSAGVPPTGVLLNKQIGVSPTSDAVNGRPSSNHPGGFVVTMCDGHSQFMSEDIEYRVYCLLMAPDNASARWPSNTPSPVIPVQYPTSWAPSGPLTPLSEADFQ
jgi:hypothetical protein